MVTEEYLKRYNVIFHKDYGFSRKFATKVTNVLRKNRVKIIDHETHQTEEDKVKDSAGSDRTIRIPKMEIDVGVRIRREDALGYKLQFTVDDKEHTQKLNQPTIFWDTQTVQNENYDCMFCLTILISENLF